uniref:Uncharacterized protein n=1 Tax=Oryza nivara TaxID=4536 RepID=A0A0E0HP14_ORYNI
MRRRRVVVDTREGVVNQGVRGCAGDEDGDIIATVVEEDDAEEPIRTMKDETSHRACQTPGQLGTNTRAGVANTTRARQGTTMNHTPMSEETSREGLQDGRGARTARRRPEWLTMTSVDDEGVEARTTMKTTRGATL